MQAMAQEAWEPPLQSVAMITEDGQRYAYI